MKSLFKIIFLTATTALAFNTAPSFANETAKVPVVDNAQSEKDKESNMIEDQYVYALGTFFGQQVEEYKKLGINLNADKLIQGIKDVSDKKNILTDAEKEKFLSQLQEEVKTRVEAKMEKDFKENDALGKQYGATFFKEQGVKKTQSGLLYKIEKPGTDHHPKDTDTVVVHYVGALIDGTEFDNSYKRGEPLSIPLNNLISGWKEGLQKIGKGGQIKLVIPQDLAYAKNPISAIPAGSTLVFDVELLDIKPASESREEAKKNNSSTSKKTNK